MRINIQKIFCGLIFICPTISYAADMFGNPAQIGTPGKFEIQIGGGKSSSLALDFSKTTGTTQIGSLSASNPVPASSSTYTEDQVFIGISYALNTRTQLFANLGTGKNSGQQSNSNAIGIKISPDSEASDVKMGLILRAQQVKMDIDGPFTIYNPFNTIYTSTNTNTFWGNNNGTEQIKYTRMDAFFGASSRTGVIRPYGGLCLTRISGTDTIAIDDTVTVYSYPISGGATATSTQHITFNATSDVSGKKYFSGVLGLSINPDSDLGMTAELQTGAQTSILLAGNIRF